MATIVPKEEISAWLGKCPGWELRGEEIAQTFKFASFVPAIAFVNQVAELAEEANHHPDIDVRWNKVTLALMTHSKGALTDADFALAAKISALRED